MSKHIDSSFRLDTDCPVRTRLAAIQESVASLQPQGTEDLSIARKPHFDVPFPPDSYFVHRPAIWTWITEQYASPTSRIALVGMGGFG